MKTVLVTLARLQHIAKASGLQYAVDPVRGIAYLRVAQAKYVAPLAEDAAA